LYQAPTTSNNAEATTGNSVTVVTGVVQD